MPTDSKTETVGTGVEITTRPEIHLSTENKIYDSLDRLKKEIDKLKKEGKTIGYVTGTFDLVHLGHAGIADFAKKHCDILIVGVAGDSLTIATKGEEFFDQDQRAIMLSSLGSIDLIFKMDNPNTDANSKEAVAYLDEVATEINPDVIIASSATDSNFTTKMHEAKRIGCKFVEYDVPAFASSTSARKWVNKNF